MMSSFWKKLPKNDAFQTLKDLCHIHVLLSPKLFAVSFIAPLALSSSLFCLWVHETNAISTGECSGELLPWGGKWIMDLNVFAVSCTRHVLSVLTRRCYRCNKVASLLTYHLQEILRAKTNPKAPCWDGNHILWPLSEMARRSHSPFPQTN